jgi:carboxymethylenebutenolidase
MERRTLRDLVGEGSAMCFDHDSTPPLPPVTGGALVSRRLVLEAVDGNRLAGYESLPEDDGGAAVVVLPDVRGLYRFYEDLADRLAGVGHHAVAIDYFGRTAGVGERDDEFPYMDHVAETTAAGVVADVAAAVSHLRAVDPDRPVFTVGFCFGGSYSWWQSAAGHGLAGAIGFYGHAARERGPGEGSVIDRVPAMTAPILALMGGDDPGIPPEVNEAFERALREAGIEHDIVTYAGAPHSFFDRKQVEFAAESADAWRRVLEFIAGHADRGPR